VRCTREFVEYGEAISDMVFAGTGESDGGLTVGVTVAGAGHPAGSTRVPRYIWCTRYPVLMPG